MRFCALLVSFLVAALPNSADAAAATRRLSIAALEIEAIQGVSPGTAKILSNLVANRVGQSGVEVITSGEIANLLGHEKQKQLMGCSEDSGCLANIASALGTDFLLAGQVGKIGSRFNLSLTLLDLRSSKVVQRASKLCEATEDALVDAAQTAVGELLLPLTGPPTATPPQPVAVVPEKATGPSRVPAYLTTALAVAAVGSGIGTGLLAKSRYGTLEKDRATLSAGQFDRAAQEIRTTALAADVLYGVAAAAAGVSIWLWVRSAPPEAPKVSLLPTAQGAALSVAGSF